MNAYSHINVEFKCRRKKAKKNWLKITFTLVHTTREYDTSIVRMILQKVLSYFKTPSVLWTKRKINHTSTFDDDQAFDQSKQMAKIYASTSFL